MKNIIEIKNLSKHYGNQKAVEDLSLSVRNGAIYGFVGPNGAGKTSTIRMMCTLLTPSAGEAWINGHSVLKAPRDTRRSIGYMPDFFGVYSDMQVWEYLDFFGACYGIDSNNRKILVADLLELVDLGHRSKSFVDKLSRGMKQRLSIARTLIHDPEVLVLDEPASGLDPRARVEIRELLVELSNMGKTIFFSTHILADVAEICTDVGIIEEGAMVATGNIQEIQRLAIAHRQFRISCLNPFSQLEAALSKDSRVSKITNRNNTSTQITEAEIEFNGTDLELSELIESLVKSDGIKLIQLNEQNRDLEKVFMRLTKGLVS